MSKISINFQKYTNQSDQPYQFYPNKSNKLIPNMIYPYQRTFLYHYRQKKISGQQNYSTNKIKNHSSNKSYCKSKNLKLRNENKRRNKIVNNQMNNKEGKSMVCLESAKDYLQTEKKKQQKRRQLNKNISIQLNPEYNYKIQRKTNALKQRFNRYMLKDTKNSKDNRLKTNVFSPDYEIHKSQTKYILQNCLQNMPFNEIIEINRLIKSENILMRTFT